MAPKLWIKDGKLIVDESGNLLECEECPCDQIDIVTCGVCSNSEAPSEMLVEFSGLVPRVMDEGCCDIANAAFAVPFVGSFGSGIGAICIWRLFFAGGAGVTTGDPCYYYSVELNLERTGASEWRWLAAITRQCQADSSYVGMFNATKTVTSIPDCLQEVTFDTFIDNDDFPFPCADHPCEWGGSPSCVATPV